MTGNRERPGCHQRGNGGCNYQPKLGPGPSVSSVRAQVLCTQSAQDAHNEYEIGAKASRVTKISRGWQNIVEPAPQRGRALRGTSAYVSDRCNLKHIAGQPRPHWHHANNRLPRSACACTALKRKRLVIALGCVLKDANLFQGGSVRGTGLCRSIVRR